MPKRLRCPRGHEWEAAVTSPETPAAPCRCPVCGAVLEDLPQESDAGADATADQPPGPAPEPWPSTQPPTTDDPDATRPPEADDPYATRLPTTNDPYATRLPTTVDQEATGPLLPQDASRPAGTPEPRPPTPPASPRRFGKKDFGPIVAGTIPGYHLVRKLGEGGFGQVWEAIAPGGAHVALKFVSLDEKFGLIEWQALQHLVNIRHPNLLVVFGTWKTRAGDWLIIGMELADRTLMARYQEAVKTGTRGIPSRELIAYLKKAARVLDFLNQPRHALGGKSHLRILHGDIKPQNILLIGEHLKLADFGLARFLEEDIAQDTLVGYTPGFAAPELYLGQASRWSDQYSLAVSYVLLRTGKLPYGDRNVPGLVSASVNGKLELSSLPAPEQTVIRRAMHRQPGQRYPNAMDMVKDLIRVFEERKQRRRLPVSLVLRPGQELVPGYRLSRLIWQNRFETVWEALGPANTSIALHVPAITSSFPMAILEFLKGLRHRHLAELSSYWFLDTTGAIARVTDRLRDQPGMHTLVLATPLEGNNLLQQLQESQNSGSAGIPREALIGYMHQVAQGLDFLNQCQHDVGGQRVGIQHLAIRPENLRLVGDTVKIGVSGAATLLDGAPTRRPGRRSKDPSPYEAPELFLNRVTRSSDQYALAITYNQLRTGLLPFEMEGAFDLSLLPQEERAVITRATAQRPRKRYPSCGEMVEALTRISQRNPQDTVQRWRKAPPLPQTKGRAAWIAGAMVVLVVLLGLLAYLLF